MDYLTNYWEVDNLSKDTRARNVIYKLKQQFGRYGIPQKLVSDNGPQFRGCKFKEFVERWGIQHETVSPYHPQANGKAESAVKTAKMLMRKAIHSGSDIWLSVLEYRNTPTQALDSSPAQRMFCRATRTRLPTKPSTMGQRPVDFENLLERKEKNQHHQKHAFDQGSKQLQPLDQGQKARVLIQGQWKQVTVVRQADRTGRSYIVKLPDGRRNRRHLREEYPPGREQEDVDVDVEQDLQRNQELQREDGLDQEEEPNLGDEAGDYDQDDSGDEDEITKRCNPKIGQLAVGEL